MNLTLLIALIISQPFLSFASGPCDDASDRDACLANAQAQASRQGSGNGNNNNNNNGNASRDNAPFNNCQRETSSLAPAPITIPPGTAYYTENPESPVTSLPTQPVPALPATSNPVVKKCQGLEGASTRLGGTLESTDSMRSQNGQMECKKRSGITADYESCVSAVRMYDSIIIAEAAMQIFQGVQTNNVQNKASQEAAQRTAAGDGQNAMYDAQTANLNNAKNLNNQQAAAYAAAVAALYSKIQSWIKESQDALLQKACGKTAAQVQQEATAAATPELFARLQSVSTTRNCSLAVNQTFETYKGFYFANRETKAALTRAAMMFAAKAIAAGIKASQLGAIAQKVQEAKKATEDPYNPATFEYCQVNSADPKCAGQSTVTTGSGLQDGGFGFGDSFGNNAFNPLGDAEDMGNDPLAPLAGSNSVADTGNPFAADAKKASGILDPAAAASTAPGQAGGGGAGGGAGAAGGGSASLGNDTPGADDSKKDTDIKANKADGRYSDASGGGFQAIKPLKEENPFANLFGDKSGKLEEDRSIASGDIDGQDSGIFAKISKRYGQVQADKRIEAKNLDE